MSISAKIDEVYAVPEGYRLKLVSSDGGETGPGQPFMTILDPTYKPKVGTVIWGGGGSVTLESDPKREYDREGYTRLKERF